MILDTDASDTAIGAVLSQIQGGYERVIPYASRRLDRREVNYCVARKELLAVVHFMRYFRQYLLGRMFLVRTDHSALTWLRRTPDPTGKQVGGHGRIPLPHRASSWCTSRKRRRAMKVPL